MPTNDTPLEREMRKAMTAINAIAEMLGTSKEQRHDALSRIWHYTQRKAWDNKLMPEETNDAND